jgi:hypothetical protein
MNKLPKPSQAKQLNTEAVARQLLNQEPMQAVAVIALDKNGDLYTCHYLHPNTGHAQVDHWKQQLRLYTTTYAKEIR